MTDGARHEFADGSVSLIDAQGVVRKQLTGPSDNPLTEHIWPLGGENRLERVREPPIGVVLNHAASPSVGVLTASFKAIACSSPAWGIATIGS